MSECHDSAFNSWLLLFVFVAWKLTIHRICVGLEQDKAEWRHNTDSQLTDQAVSCIYKTPSFITIFAKVCQWIVFGACPTQSTLAHHTCITYILIYHVTSPTEHWQTLCNAVSILPHSKYTHVHLTLLGTTALKTSTGDCQLWYLMYWNSMLSFFLGGGRSRPTLYRAFVRKQVTVLCYPRTRTGGRDNSVDIATRYRLDGPGIESRRGWDFPHPSRPALGPTQPPVSFPGVKWLRCSVHSAPPSSGCKSSPALNLHGWL